MNLALQDVAELVQGLVAVYRSGDHARLDAYSWTRLPKIWRAVELSSGMLEMLLAHTGGTAAAEFHEAGPSYGGRRLLRRLRCHLRRPRPLEPNHLAAHAAPRHMLTITTCDIPKVTFLLL